MQAIILAAGMGKRLKSKTAEHTKSMVAILGKTFLEHSLDKLTQFNLSRIVLVIGYCGDEVRRVIGNSYNGVPVEYVENVDYATTNNIYSLYLARDYLAQEDTLLLESDLIYDTSVIKRLLDNPYPNLAAVAKYKTYMDGTVVKINKNDEITAFISKEHFDYTEIDSYYKTVNIYKFSKEFLTDQYLPFLSAYCSVVGLHSYYEQVLKVLLALDKHDLRVCVLDTEKWYEVDDLQDYDIAESMFCNDLSEQAQKLHSRFGGFWRFDELKDFCYLVNPYFPPKRMIAEMQNMFVPLLENYPSGQKVHKSLVENIWNIAPDMVLVGNGAAELINATMPALTGRIGIILPTFQEYPSRIKNGEIVYFKPENPDFSYTTSDLKQFASKIDTLVLINPDNPSGNFIQFPELIDLIDFYNAHGKRILVDESFVDFAIGFDENTLLRQDILNKYHNLIVMKSISKSYGVPGLRLGIMASSNTDFIAQVQKNMPVWNINSFAEMFLQILNKYTSVYRDACRKIAENRDWLFNELSKISCLRPIQSGANYILCEVLSGKTSAEICYNLLSYNVLIKDCANKTGFNGKNYIRLAVKSETDNSALIRALKELE